MQGGGGGVGASQSVRLRSNLNFDKERFWGEFVHFSGVSGGEVQGKGFLHEKLFQLKGELFRKCYKSVFVGGVELDCVS